jgi:zinc/manganese transport system ATP-binding protein
MQRVLFARLMVQESAVILLDEPFNAIDARTTADLLALVTRWHAEKRTVIAVLHDYEQVRARFPETLLMARECLGWGATETVLTPHNLLKARARSEAWDEDAPHCHQAVA